MDDDLMASIQESVRSIFDKKLQARKDHNFICDNS